MEAAPRQMVWSAAVVLAGVAVLGLYLGAHRSASGPGDFSETTVAAGATGHAARAAAEPAPPLPAMDETQVRQIARQEAEALLNRPHAASKHVKADDTADTTDNPDETGNTISPSEQASGPASPPATPAPPPPPATSGPPD